MNKKGSKTTIIAIIGFLLILSLFIGLYMEKIEPQEVFNGLAGIGTSIALFVGLFAKDQDKSHTNND